MDLSAHTSLAPLAEAVAAVLRPASAAGIEIYIAGALARDLWLEFAYGIDTGRRPGEHQRMNALGFAEATRLIPLCAAGCLRQQEADASLA